MKHRGAPGRRRAAAAALERLVSCRGPAVLDPSPYERSASLFPTLISMIATEPDEPMRDSALRIIGLLSIEPLQYRAAASKADTAARQLALRESGSAHDVSKQGVTGDAATAAEGTEANAQQLEPAAADGKAKPDETIVVADGHAAAASQLGRNGAPPRRWGDDLPPSSPQYMPTIALRELMAILHDASSLRTTIG